MAKYVDIVFRHWIRFLLLVLLVPGAFTVASLTMGKVHQGSAAMWVQSPPAFGSPAPATGWNPYATPSQNQADVLQQLLQTRDFQDAVGARLAASGSVTQPQEREGMIRSLPRQVKVTSPGSHLVAISYTCQVPALCLEVLNDTLELFRQRVVQLQQQDAQGASTSLPPQLRNAQKTASASGDALRQYLKANPRVTLADAPSTPELLLLVDQRDRDQSQVTALAQELSQAQLIGLGAAGALSTSSRVIDPARLAQDPISLGAIQRALLVWLACFTAAVIYLLILAAADRAARDPRDLERRTGLPVVANIPRLPHMEKLW